MTLKQVYGVQLTLKQVYDVQLILKQVCGVQLTLKQVCDVGPISSCSQPLQLMLTVLCALHSLNSSLTMAVAAVARWVVTVRPASLPSSSHIQ